MNDKIKNLLSIKNLAIIVFSVSLAANAYFFGGKWLNQDRINRMGAGAMAVRNFIVKEVQEKGRVIVEDDKGQRVILIQEIKQEK